MRSIDKQIEDSLRLFQETLPQLLVPAALGALVGGLPLAMVVTSGPQPPTPETMDWAGFGWAMLFQALVNFAVQGMLIKMLLTHARDGATLPAGEALQAGIAMLPAMFFAALLYMLAMVAMMFLLIIPGIWMAVAGVLVQFAVVIEGRGPLGALQRSIELVRGRWWRTLGLLLLATVVMLLGFLLCTALVKPLADAAFGGGWPTEAALSTVIGALFTPLFNALLLTVFLDYAGDPDAGAPQPPSDRIAA